MKWLNMKTGLRDNRGLSLVELVIVIAILAVLSGAVIASLGIVSNARTKQCINSIQTAIGKSRITTMGKKNTTLRIYENNGKVWADETADGNVTTTEMGNSGIGLTFTDSAGTTTSITSADMNIVFDRSSGVVKSSNFVSAQAGSYQVVVVPETGKSYVQRIP